MVIQQFPEPDDMTPWEAIEEFRNDHEATESLRAFRRWLKKVSREGLTGPEAAEELQFLLAEYVRYIGAHRMKTNMGLLDGLLVCIECIDNPLTGLAKLGIAAIRRRFERLEAELSAPGTEVAYVAKARERFGQP